MGPKKSELLILILQFLDDEKYIKTAHMLEKESACYFNMKYFEDQVLAGEWDEVERYLSGFTKVEDNSYSMKTFFEIRKHKYVEALDRKDRTKAVEILYNDLKVFNSYDQDTYKELLQLIHLENIREHEKFSTYGNTTFARKILLLKLREPIESNPQVHKKLAFPALPAFRLKYLIDQSLKWQHKHCKCEEPNPDMKTLFVNHVCGPQTPTNNSLVGAISKGTPFLPMVTPAPFEDGTALSFGNSSSLTGWMKNPNPPMPHAVVAAGTVNLIPPQNAAGSQKRLRTLPEIYTGIYSHCVNSKHFVKCSHIDSADEVTYTRPTDPPSMYSQDDLPMKVARSLNQGSKVISMDFHPKEHTILLVGTSTGGIGIWDAGSGEKLAQTTFRIWNVSNCPLKMQAALPGDELAVSVNRCIWNLDGEKIGVAFSKSIAHIYSYSGTGELRPHLEINAHIGGVNDIAFGCNNKQLSIITCGDDKSIKVWDAATGHRKYIFEGHEAPVYCIFPHQKENVQFIFSVDIAGKIKLWAYNHKGSIEEHDAPGKCRIAKCYSTDGLRIFLCGTSKEGESYLVEWNRKDGTIKHTYSGLRKRSFGMVQFDTTRNRFLAAGNDSQLKFWDMDNVNILTTTDVEEGCLEAIPCLRFNKEGSLLAVTTNENRIKILANSDGLHFIY